MKKTRSFSLGFVCRVASPVLSASFYVFIVLIAVMLAALPIVALARVSAGEMLLPPFMSDTPGGYTITLGNGLSMFAPSESVAADDIKASIYLAFMLWIATLAVCVPVCRFVSKLCAAVRDDKLFDPKNAAYVNYTGIAVLAGGLALSFLTRYYNFRLVALFAADAGSVSFAPGVNLGFVFVGLFIMLLGSIWGGVCRAHTAVNLPENI